MQRSMRSRRIYVKPYIHIRVKITAVMKKSQGFDKELFFRALADRTRLRLLNLMRGDEVCVCFFVEILKTNQPKISRHLAYLRRAGIVGVDEKVNGCTTESSNLTMRMPRVCCSAYCPGWRTIRRCSATASDW